MDTTERDHATGTAGEPPVEREAEAVALDPGATAPLVIPRLALGIVGLALLVVALGGLAALAQQQEVNALDTFASPFVHRFASPALDAVMAGASLIGSVPSLLLVALVSSAFARWRGRPGLALLVAVSAIGGILVNEGLKTLVHRPRPRLEWSIVLPDFSFPSGHSMDSIVVFLAVAFLAWSLFGRRAGVAATVAAVLLALLIGISRIYLGAHYLTDVVGGYVAGLGWLLVVVGVFTAGWRRREAARSGRGRAARARPGAT